MAEFAADHHGARRQDRQPDHRQGGRSSRTTSRKSTTSSRPPAASSWRPARPPPPPAEKPAEVDRVHGRPRRPGRPDQEDQRHQGGPRDHRPRPQGSQGPGRRGARSRSRRTSPRTRPNALKKKLEDGGAKVSLKSAIIDCAVKRPRNIRLGWPGVRRPSRHQTCEGFFGWRDAWNDLATRPKLPGLHSSCLCGASRLLLSHASWR